MKTSLKLDVFHTMDGELWKEDAGDVAEYVMFVQDLADTFVVGGSVRLKSLTAPLTTLGRGGPRVRCQVRPTRV